MQHTARKSVQRLHSVGCNSLRGVRDLLCLCPRCRQGGEVQYTVADFFDFQDLSTWASVITMQQYLDARRGIPCPTTFAAAVLPAHAADVHSKSIALPPHFDRGQE